MAVRSFPPGFLLGSGTSAYQIEGGTDIDGRGPSIWDTFAALGGTRDGADGARAADHRHRWGDDVALLRALGMPAYRFSVAWPRVQPAGRGPVSREGLDFYRRLVDDLLAAGIEPAVTLYHWDLPQALEDAGGWPARDTALRFAEYAGVVADALGDRVRRWGTINEPWCAAMLGYAAGIHAPGRTEPGAAAAAAHHLLLAHGLAVDVLRSRLPAGAEVSVTLNPYPVVAEGDTEADHDAARRIDGIANRLWYDPVLMGRYPDDVLADLSSVSDLAHIRDGDLAEIARPIDVLGLNYYRRYHVRHEPGASAVSPWPGSPDVDVTPPDEPSTANGWRIEPRGLYEVLDRVRRDYRTRRRWWSTNAARRSATRSRPTGGSTTRGGSRSSTPTCGPPSTPSTTVSTSPGSTCGRSSTTSSGRRATPTGSGSCTSTSTPSCARRRRAPSGSRRSSPPTVSTRSRSRRDPAREDAADRRAGGLPLRAAQGNSGA